MKSSTGSMVQVESVLAMVASSANLDIRISAAPRASALRHEDTDHVLARVHVQRGAERTVPAEASGHAGNIIPPGHDRKAQAPATRFPEVFEERRGRLLLGRQVISSHELHRQ